VGGANLKLWEKIGTGEVFGRFRAASDHRCHPAHDEQGEKRKLHYSRNAEGGKGGVGWRVGNEGRWWEVVVMGERKREKTRRERAEFMSCAWAE
jgi:hypothetical protein